MPRSISAASISATRASSPGDARVLVLALRLLDASHRERRHVAQVMRSQARQQATQAAGRARSAAASYDTSAVRAWALKEGLDVPRRGRYLPADVVAAYQAAHP